MKVVQKILKNLLNKALPPIVRIYLKKERSFIYKDIKIKVLPGVFHPGFFFSTKIMLKFLDTLNLNDKSFLDVGCGTGIISVFAAKKNACVTAIDINPTAIKCSGINADNNGVELNLVLSDLFTNLPETYFEYIVINPPYYLKKPENSYEHAWYCGENLQFYEELYSGLPNYTNDKTNIYMVLSDVAPINEVIDLAKKFGFQTQLIYEQTMVLENLYIYMLELA